MFVRAKRRGQWTYLMVVENRWVDGRVRQTVLHSLGRLDVLVATGKLDGLIASAARFSEKLVRLRRTGSARSRRGVEDTQANDWASADV